MKKIFLSLLAIVPAALYAQDIIYKTDGTRVETKVQEIGTEEIRYKMYNNQDGPVYVIKRKDVQMIAYQNGTHELIAAERKGKMADPDSLWLNRKKNIVSFNLFDITFTNLSVAYEHIFSKGYIGVRIPVSIGLGTLSKSTTAVGENTNFLTGRLWGTGLDINFYPLGQSRVSYFMGPSFITGSFRYGGTYYDYSIYPYPYYSGTYTGYHFAWLINNGVLIQPTKNMNVSMALGLGMKEDMTRGRDYVEPNANFYLNFGYRF